MNKILLLLFFIFIPADNIIACDENTIICDNYNLNQQNGDLTLSESQLTDLLKIVRYASNKYLVEKTKTILLVDKDVDLLNHIKFCDQTDINFGTFAAVQPHTKLRMTPNFNKVAPNSNNSFVTLKKYIKKRRSITVIENINLDQICLESNQSLKKSASLLIHELTHLIAEPLQDEQFINATTTIDQYADYQINRTGGEFDAHVAEIMANSKIRQLDNKKGLHHISDHDQYLNEKTQIVDTAGLKGDITLKYTQRFSANLISAKNLKLNYLGHEKIYLNILLNNTNTNLNIVKDPTQIAKYKFQIKQIELDLIDVKREINSYK